MLNNIEARQLFRKHYREYSDSLWYRTKRIFSNDFPMTEQNVIWVATIKKMLPRFDIAKLDIVSTVRTVNQFLTSEHKSITGKEFLELLATYGITLHKNTVTKYFRSIGGFSHRRPYTLPELTPIILASFTHKFRSNLTEKFTNLENN